MRGAKRMQEAMEPVLEELGFEVEAQEVSVPLAQEGEWTLDYLLRRDGTRYLTTVRRSSDTAAFRKSSFPRAFMNLETARRQLDAEEDDTPMIILETDQLTATEQDRLSRHLQRYAPDYELLVLVGDPARVAWDSEAGQVNPTASPEPEGQQAPSSPLAYSDLELWLTKYLVYSNQEPPLDPRYEQQVANPNQLAGAAEVSIDRAYTFARELEGEGCVLRDQSGEFEVDAENLLVKWQEHYAWEDNEKIGHFSVPEGDGSPLDRVMNWIRSLPDEHRHEFVITGEAGKVLVGDAASGVDTVQLLYLGSGAIRPHEWKLEPRSRQESDVEVRRAKHSEAVNRAKVEMEGVMVADEIQQRLDSQSVQ